MLKENNNEIALMIDRWARARTYWGILLLFFVFLRSITFYIPPAVFSFLSDLMMSFCLLYIFHGGQFKRSGKTGWWIALILDTSIAIFFIYSIITIQEYERMWLYIPYVFFLGVHIRFIFRLLQPEIKSYFMTNVAGRLAGWKMRIWFLWIPCMFFTILQIHVFLERQNSLRGQMNLCLHGQQKYCPGTIHVGRKFWE